MLIHKYNPLLRTIFIIQLLLISYYKDRVLKCRKYCYEEISAHIYCQQGF